MKTLLFGISLCFSITVSAQDSVSVRVRQSVYFEVGGTSQGIGVSYDRSFAQRKNWIYGARIGVSGTYFSIFRPIFLGEVYGLTGKKSNYLELGIGTSYGYARYGEDVSTNTITYYDIRQSFWLVPRIGYRYQRDQSGTVFRAGITPPLVLGDGTARFRFLIGVSLGRSF